MITVYGTLFGSFYNFWNNLAFEMDERTLHVLMRMLTYFKELERKMRKIIHFERAFYIMNLLACMKMRSIDLSKISIFETFNHNNVPIVLPF